LLAVLKTASVVTRRIFSPLTASAGRFDEAREWLFSDDADWFCSFVSICTLLNLEPNYIRRGLRQWETRTRKATQKKPQGASDIDQRLVA
jgi:hypothetical protein